MRLVPNSPIDSDHDLVSMSTQERTALITAILEHQGLLNDRLQKVNAARTRDPLRQRSINQARAILTHQSALDEHLYQVLSAVRPERHQR